MLRDCRAKVTERMVATTTKTLEIRLRERLLEMDRLPVEE
jgi:hypothetical protein